MTADLITWLRAQLDEDERIARATRGLGKWSAYREGGGDGWAFEDESGEGAEAIVGDETTARHNVRHDPARVLREVEAKRRILDEMATTIAGVRQVLVCDDACECGPGDPGSTCHIVRLLALPYADQPGYRREWAPSKG